MIIGHVVVIYFGPIPGWMWNAIELLDLWYLIKNAVSLHYRGNLEFCKELYYDRLYFRFFFRLFDLII